MTMLPKAGNYCIMMPHGTPGEQFEKDFLFTEQSRKPLQVCQTDTY